ncbi:MAG: class I SAM-dependent methyltransferase [Kofleriaceae bacterium]|nr:class I SAM-dependent methyltransferase [Kofleriaceae bacterium]
MRDDQPSTTARIAAFARAHHACYDRPVILDDQLAPAWFTDEERAMFSQHLAQAADFFLPGETFATPAAARAAVLRAQSIPINVARARYAEDTLLALISTGTRYVLLGAGLDAFAFRRIPLDIDVIEIDHPATQRWKRARIAQLGWSIPPRLAFIERDLVRDALDLAPAPSVIAWLGVTYYLSREAIGKTLDSLAALATPGSALVLDYLDDAAFDPARCAPSIARMQEAVRRTGEPMQSGFAPADLARLLGEHGWRVDEDLGADAIAARYFAGRDDGLAPMPHFRLARATRKL